MCGRGSGNTFTHCTPGHAMVDLLRLTHPGMAAALPSVEINPAIILCWKLMVPLLVPHEPLTPLWVSQFAEPITVAVTVACPALPCHVLLCCRYPAYLHITDIAGLVRGASEGAGLGNAFLSHIAAVDGIFHVVSDVTNS